VSAFLDLSLFLFLLESHSQLSDAHYQSNLDVQATPAPAVFLQGILALAFLIVGDIAALIEFASFLIW
jgi:uncharacterized membrane protein